MNENNQKEKGLFEILEERSPECETNANSKTSMHEYNQTHEEHTFEFLVQDMFLDHFFP